MVRRGRRCFKWRRRLNDECRFRPSLCSRRGKGPLGLEVKLTVEVDLMKGNAKVLSCSDGFGWMNTGKNINIHLLTSLRDAVLLP